MRRPGPARLADSGAGGSVIAPREGSARRVHGPRRRPKPAQPGPCNGEPSMTTQRQRHVHARKSPARPSRRQGARRPGTDSSVLSSLRLFLRRIEAERKHGLTCPPPRTRRESPGSNYCNAEVNGRGLTRSPYVSRSSVASIWRALARAPAPGRSRESVALRDGPGRVEDRLCVVAVWVENESGVLRAGRSRRLHRARKARTHRSRTHPRSAP
jgi:hypothetical protein